MYLGHPSPLRRILTGYALSGLDLKRTRDPAILDSCDIVVDVGAVYDETKQRFDHHQRGFVHVFEHGFNTKLSSAGLVYKYAYPPTPLEIIVEHFPHQAFRQRNYSQ
jgi:uncharacterized UPF0160 family protein